MKRKGKENKKNDDRPMSSKSSRIDFLQSRPSLTTSAAANPKIHHESNSHSNLNHDDDGHDE